MIDRVIDFSVRHKFSIFVAVAIGCVFGWWSIAHTHLDAIPDLGDTQVIVLSRWDRSPDLVETQVTYPIVTAMLGAPHVKTVRGVSDFGYSYVYVIFEYGTDIYWARSRTLENMAGVLTRLPEGVKTELGPDATSLGWVFQYALVDTTGNHSLSELRSYEDWNLRYHLRSVPGVADVAPVGGYTRQYQVNLDPNRLQGYGIRAERYPVNVRYMRDFRSDVDSISHILVPAGGQRQAPIGELATIQITNGPAMIRDENGQLTGYVYVDLANRDPGSYIAEAGRMLREKTKLQPGYAISWGGQFESIERANRRLRFVVPATIVLVMFLIYINTKSFSKTLIVLLAVPFSAIGSIWALYFLHYNLSVAVWVGLIALLSIDAETGVFMLLYLDLAYEEARMNGRLRTLEDLREAIVYGAAKRLRPKFMTFATTCIGLLSVMWSIGTGADVMKRIAAPMVGGIFTSFILELLVYPVVYQLWRRKTIAEPFVDPTASTSNDWQPGRELALSAARD